MSDKELQVVSEQKIVPVQELTPMQAFVQLSNQGIDLDKIEKAMELQERYEANEAKKDFFIAMSATQMDMPVIYETRNNDQTRSKYAAYKDIVRDAKPIYTKHGLSISFYEGVSDKDGWIRTCADVYHVKGHSKSYHIDLPIDDKGPKGSPVKTQTHGVKSSNSYARGILLCNIFNIPTSSDVDDDGNAAGGLLYVGDDEISAIRDLLSALEESESGLCKWLEIESLNYMTDFHYKQAHTNLNYKLERKNGNKQ